MKIVAVLSIAALLIMSSLPADASVRAVYLEQGMSHCVIALRLADGRTTAVRHDHDMRSVPCLTPGETIRLIPKSIK